MSIGRPPTRSTDLEVDVTDETGRLLPRARLPRDRPHHHRRGGRVAARRATTTFEAAAAQRLPRPALRRRPALRQHSTSPSSASCCSPSGASTGVHDTLMCRNGRRIAARLLDVAGSRRRALGSPDLQAAACRARRRRGTRTRRTGSVDLSYHAVGAWMPLDDTDVDNGCLWFVPGSHRGDVLAAPPPRRRPRGAHPRARRRGRHVGRGARCRCAPAAASFHHPRTMHGVAPEHDRPAPARVGERVPDRAGHARRAGRSAVGAARAHDAMVGRGSRRRR